MPVNQEVSAVAAHPNNHDPTESEDIVDAETSESLEDQLLKEGVEDIEEGETEQVMTHDVLEASRIVDRMGRHDLALRLRHDAFTLGAIAESDIGRGRRELEQAEGLHRQAEVEKLAVQVVDG